MIRERVICYQIQIQPDTTYPDRSATTVNGKGSFAIVLHTYFPPGIMAANLFMQMVIAGLAKDLKGSTLECEQDAKILLKIPASRV